MQPSRSSGLPSIGRYELVAGIASGGMGSVVLARLASAGGFQRLVALKLLHREYTSDPAFLTMFLNEARIAARINHPNVVAIQEVSACEEHGYFLVMDYVEGFPLSDLVSRLGELPLRERLRIVVRVMLDALQGLEAAHSLLDDDGHSLQVVHRDVSPQNLLVGVDGIARVTDFGIAHAAGRVAVTRAGEVRGKVAYLSPESVRGQPIDARSDLFSAGVVLWEAVALRRLFSARTPLDTANNVLTMEIPSLSSLAPGVPGDLDAVCSTALSRDPALRFQSARAFATALEAALRVADLVGEAHEVGAFVSRVFAEPLAERREAVRRVAHDTVVSSGPKSFEVFAALQKAPAGSPGMLALEATRSIRSPASPGSMVVPAQRVPPASLGVERDPDFDQRVTSDLREDDAPPAVRLAVESYRAQQSASAPVPPCEAPRRARVTSSPAPALVPFGGNSPPGSFPPVQPQWGVAGAPSPPTPPITLPPSQPLQRACGGENAIRPAAPSWPDAPSPVSAIPHAGVNPGTGRWKRAVALVIALIVVLAATAWWFGLRGRS